MVMASSLDRFPPEIFFIIFEHLWADEILSSFHEISVYVENILSSYNRYFVNLKSIRKSDFDEIVRYLRSSQVIGLILSDENETPNQSQLFQSDFSMKQLVNLRSLKFVNLDDDGQSFFSDLVELKHLISFEIDVKIFLPLVKIPKSVKRLIINIKPNIFFDIDESISMIPYEQLRYLSVCHCSCQQLQKIFIQSVQLTSLKIVLPILTEEELNRFINFHEKESPLSPLKRLSLSIYGASKSNIISREDFLSFDLFWSYNSPRRT